MKRVMVISPHPDDAELAAGGIIAKMKANGCDVLILDLTDGEPTPFGCRDLRISEAKAAAKVLSVNRIMLDLPNRSLECNIKSRKAVAQAIRNFKPDVLFGPVKQDYHPDHQVANEIITKARFDAKLSKTDMTGESWWVKEYYQYYSPHRNLIEGVSFLVDVSQYWQTKVMSVAKYQSQIKFKSPSNSGFTLVEKIEIVGKYFGLGAGTSYAEPVYSPEVIKAGSMDIFSLG